LSGQPESTSLVHKLDPRVRLLATLGFALVVAPGHDLIMLGSALALALLLMGLARLPVAATLRRMLAMDTFIVAMLLLLPFTLPGEPLFYLGGLPASREGVLRAVEIGLKANAIILMVLTLVSTLEVVTLGHALYHLYVPEKLVQLLLFTVRYITVLQHEQQRLQRAMKARAFVPRSNWHTWRSIGYLCGMLLVRSLERSERIVAAMKCRGFQGRYYLLDHFAMTCLDWGFAVCFGGLLLGLAGMGLA
jgi:cobalt/nickel transport system permease protein